MRESIGSASLYNIIIVFLSIIFALILGSLIYYKAFKVNKSLVAIIQKYEGYNDLAVAEIDTQLSSIAYMRRNLGDCPIKESTTSLVNYSKDSSARKSVFPYCIYRFTNPNNARFYSYGVLTYIVIDLPLINSSGLKFNVYSKTDWIFKFNWRG